MKSRISATVEESTLKVIEELLKEGNYRNKSHVIEDAIKLLKEVESNQRVKTLLGKK